MISEHDIDVLISIAPNAEDTNTVVRFVLSKLRSCPYCNALFPNTFQKGRLLPQLADHIFKYHSRRLPKTQCPLCGLSVKDRDDLFMHISEQHAFVSRDSLSEGIVKMIEEKAESLVWRRGNVHSTLNKPWVSTRLLWNEETDQRNRSSPPAPTIQTNVDLRTRFTTTIRGVDFEAGALRFPSKLKAQLRRINTILMVLANDQEQETEYDATKGLVCGLDEWFRGNAIAPGDKIYIMVVRWDPPLIKIWTLWERTLSYLLKCPPEDFKWQHFPLRDCLILTFRILGRPAHYRELYAIVSKHRDVSMDSISGVLSRYNGVLFDNLGSGKWSLREHIGYGLRPQEPSVKEEPGVTEEDGRKLEEAVAKIKEQDLVYVLLKRLKEPLSYSMICQELGDMFGVGWKALSEIGFIDLTDFRIRRLDNGDFALEEWFEKTLHDEIQELVKFPPEAPCVPIFKIRKNLFYRLKDWLIHLIKASLRSLASKQKKG